MRRTRSAPVRMLDSEPPVDGDSKAGEKVSFKESAQAVAAKDANTIIGWRVFALSLLAVNALLSLILIVLNFMSASRPTAPFITRGNGEIESLEYMSGSDRSSPMIVNFVRTSMIGIFTWNNTLPEEGNPPDPGVAIGQGKISTTSYRYTFALSTGFAKEFRSKLAEISANIRGTNSTETAYIPSHISDPKKISGGVWEVDVVGDLYIGGGGTNGYSIPINRRLTIKAVPPITLSEVSVKYNKSLAKAIARTRASGLEITSMTPLTK
jgi:hypothetical protein